MFKLLFVVSWMAVTWMRGSYGQGKGCSPHGIVPGSSLQPVNGACNCRHPTRDVEEHISALCEPFIYDNTPKYGVRSGATMFIYGVYLNDSGEYGNETLSVTLEQIDLELDVEWRNDTLIQAHVPPLPDSSSASLNNALSVKVVLPNGDVVGHKGNVSYMYRPDPIIHQIVPGKSILSGGIPQTITGENLDSSMFVFMGILKMYHGIPQYFPDTITAEIRCNVTNSTLMLCTTPRIPPGYLPNEYQDRNRTKRQANTEAVFYINRPNDRFNFHPVFFFDRLETYNNVTHGDWRDHDANMLEMYYDPAITKWEDEPHIFRVYKGETELLIQGTRFLHSTEEKDYSITIGSEVCKITKMYSNSIHCTPPQEQPEDAEYHKDGNPRVLLEVGYLRYTVGYVKYYMKWMDEPAYFYAVVAGIPGVVVFVILLVIAVVAIRRFLKAYRIVKIDPKSKADLLKRLPKDLRTRVRDSKIERKLIKKGREVGHGQFGIVFLGQKMKRANGTEAIEVAIKTIKEGDIDIDVIREFLEEGLMMKDYTHANVLPLIGIALEGNSPMIVLPFMELGDLKNFIKKTDVRLTVRDLVCFGYQVACGMSYLSGGPNSSVRPLVHRDLAARNCMIDRAQVVKIADFGLARDLKHREDYYTAKNTRALPVKWMAPEAMKSSKFTTKSDVWSFGVLLWELLTRGAHPYAGIRNRELQMNLEHGHRLEKPIMCPDAVYQVMRDCWMEFPNDRPDFPSVQHDLGFILQNCGISIQASEPPTPLNQQLSQKSPDYDVPVPAYDGDSIQTATTGQVSMRSGLSSRQNSSAGDGKRGGGGGDVTGIEGTYIDSRLLPPTASYMNPSYDQGNAYLEPVSSVTAPHPPGNVNGNSPSSGQHSEPPMSFDSTYVTPVGNGRAPLPHADERDVHIAMAPMQARQHPDYDRPSGAHKDYENSGAARQQYGGQQYRQQPQQQQQQQRVKQNAGYSPAW